MKLSPIQQKVLAHIAWNGRISPEDLAKRLGIRAHTARYTIQQLKQILNLRAYCFTDPFKIGLVPYRALFSVNSADQALYKKMVRYLQTCPEVSWFHELHGHYQFLMAIRVSGTQRLDAFMYEFDKQFGEIIVSRTLAEMLRTTYFMPWRAHSGKGPREHFEYRHDSEKVAIDSLDMKMLECLKNAPLVSQREISRIIGVPASTVSFRFEKLVSSRVILGFGCDYDPRAAGSEHYLILIKLQGLGGGLYEKFFEFASYHPRIARVTRMIGEWDLEMELELDDSLQLNEVIHQLYSHGAGCVRRVLAHTWGVEHRFRSASAA